MATQTASSFSSSSSYFPKYDAFLSFCGVDTRNKFTDRLYAALKQRGIITFRDDKNLERGKYISQELLKAIEESRFAIVILSKNYVYSRWCMIELVKIVECMKEKKLTILPVFYHVDPSDVRKCKFNFDVRNQMGAIVNIDDMQEWKAALTEVGNIAGWHLEEIGNTLHLAIMPVLYQVDTSDVRKYRLYVDFWNQMDTIDVRKHRFNFDVRSQIVTIDVRKYRLNFDVRSQMGNIANIDNVQARKAAMKELANTSGWHVQDRHEAVVVQEICRSIFNKLQFSSNISKELVGIESRVSEMLDLYLDESSGGVRFVGICGMGGIGKMTLALEIYERISGSFEASSYIADVREKTKNQHLVSLQEQLLSNILTGSDIKIWNVHEGINIIGNRLRRKKVLIVLDDVDGEKQLEALVGNRDWFGLGSRIIVTSRDSHLLRRCGVHDIYEAKGLDKDEALQLFSLRAFKKPHPKENYEDFSMCFVNYTNGLPLALKVLGSLLFNKSTDEWKCVIDKLKVEPNKEILDILLISFDGLTDTQKELFLDIACFFKGENKGCIRDILQSFGYYPDYNIGVLVNKSLIRINENGTLWMHNLLQEMGQEIVRRGSPKEASGRTRLWLYEDILHVLKNNTIRNRVKLPQGLDYLSNELRIIEWHGYPLSSMPTNFQPNKLVELKMHCSSIKRLWDGIMNLDELKLIDLRNSQNFETPNLSGVPKLKQLILQGCTGLSKIHPSLENLKQLIRLDLNDLPLSVELLTGLIKLDLRGCKNLSSLPNACYSSMSLKILTLSGCSKLDALPESLGNLKGLEELDVSGTAIKYLPTSINYLKNLRVLSLRGCKGLSPKPSNKLFSFPSMQKRRSPDPTAMLEFSLSGLWSLTELDLSYCNLQAIPNAFDCLSSLLKLNLEGNNCDSLPKSMILLSNLKDLVLSCCTNLQSLPELPLNIKYIDATQCTSLETLSSESEYDFQPALRLLNCVKLIENQGYNNMLLTILSRYFINEKHYRGQERLAHYIDIPGGEIPNWFCHRNVGASVSLQMPLGYCNKLMGIAVCVVFVFRQHNPLDQLDFKDWGLQRFTHELSCSIE
nr:TMV resistance protein N-like [Quercus suber]